MPLCYERYKKESYEVTITASVAPASAKAVASPASVVTSIKFAGSSSIAVKVKEYPLKSPSAAQEEISPAETSAPWSRPIKKNWSVIVLTIIRGLPYARSFTFLCVAKSCLFNAATKV